MGIRVVQLGCGVADADGAPRAVAVKPFLLSDGKLQLEASLDKAVYSHGDPVIVHLQLHNNSNKSVRRIKV